MSFVRTINVYKCDVCGKEEAWNNKWFYKLIPHASGGPGPWDETITVCSNECKEKFDKEEYKR